MQLNVVRGEPVAGSIRLFELHKGSTTPQHKILRGVLCTPEALARKVIQQASDGASLICIDECSERQIHHLEQLQHDWPSELRICAVVRCDDFSH